MGELYFIISSIALLVGITVFCFYKKMKIAGSFFASIGVTLAAHEIIGKILVDRTVSQEVWIISTQGWQGWVFLFAVTLLLTNVIVHFWWKNIFDKDYAKRKLG